MKRKPCPLRLALEPRDLQGGEQHLLVIGASASRLWILGPIALAPASVLLRGQVPTLLGPVSTLLAVVQTLLVYQLVAGQQMAMPALLAPVG